MFLLRSEGRWEDAENVQRKIIRNEKGTSYISLHGITNLARTYWKQGRYTEAENAARRSVQESQAIWGEENPRTQTSNQLLASVLQSQHKFREASSIGRKSTHILRNIMGENHPDTIASLENQALRSPDVRHLEQKRRQIVVTWTSVVGQDDPNTLASMDHLVEEFLRQGKVKESIEMRQEVYRLRRLHLGEAHPDSLKSESNLAWALVHIFRLS